MPQTVIIGCGGAGCNAVSRVEDGTPIIKMNTGTHDAETTISMSGGNVNGCRGDPDLGWALAFDNKDDISKAIAGYRNVIVAAGLGGGTGSGAIPVISECVKAYNMNLISVVSVPMSFEAKRRAFAMLQMRKVIEISNRTIIFDIERMPDMGGSGMKISEAINSTNEMMKEAMARIITMLNGPFFSLLSEKVYTVAYATGSNPVEASERALSTTFFEANLSHGKIIVTSDSIMSRSEEDEVSRRICDITGIMPEVVHGDYAEGHGMMLFIPISYHFL